MASLLYIEEHLGCENYQSVNKSIFSKHQLKKNEKFRLSMKNEYLFLFVLEGQLFIRDAKNEDISMSQNQMYSLGDNFDGKGFCVENSSFILLAFDRPRIKCDEFSLLKLKKNLPKEDLTVRSLPIKNPIKVFLNGLQLYLDNKMYCRHLQDIKNSEWFFIMRGFYTKEENAMFLYPIIEERNPFMAMILENYKRISSVEELAEVCHVSTKTLTRNFKTTFKMTPKQWLLKQKRSDVRLQLLQSNEGLKNISQELGFCSPSHLGDYCKKQFDQTPIEIKRSI